MRSPWVVLAVLPGCSHMLMKDPPRYAPTEPPECSTGRAWVYVDSALAVGAALAGAYWTAEATSAEDSQGRGRAGDQVGDQAKAFVALGSAVILAGSALHGARTRRECYEAEAVYHVRKRSPRPR